MFRSLFSGRMGVSGYESELLAWQDSPAMSKLDFEVRYGPA